MMKYHWQRIVSMVLIVGLMALICSCHEAKPEDTPGETQASTQTTAAPTTQTPQTQPPTTLPPTTAAPTTVPPTTEPPTEPPTTVPPTTVPPATEPPTEPKPTETEPKPTETEPPKPVNDIGKAISADEFSMTVLSAGWEGEQYVVTLTLTYSGSESHALSAKQRFFVVNDDRRSTAVENIYDADGNSLLGASIEPGQTLTIKAVFNLKADFGPTSFRYVYDIMGFRRLQAQL